MFSLDFIKKDASIKHKHMDSVWWHVVAYIHILCTMVDNCLICKNSTSFFTKDYYSIQLKSLLSYYILLSSLYFVSNGPS